MGPQHTNCLSTYLWPTNDLLTEQTNIRLYPLTSLTNNTTTEITLTIHGWKCTNHWLESEQPITSWLNWPMTATIRCIYTINWGSPIHMTLKMTSTQSSKRQSLSTTTVLFRTILTQTITLNRPKRFYLNGCTIEFHPQIPKLEHVHVSIFDSGSESDPQIHRSCMLK